MTDPDTPVSDDRADYVRRLIASRRPGLTEADLAEVAVPDPDALPASIGEQVMEVLDFMMTRMDRIERAVIPA